jgi:prepilin-type N-terminal cleavage/methylation domain-containing protein
MSASKLRGFTLIEMMVVIAIIGVLAGLLLVAIGPARQLARQMECANNLREIGKAVLTYTAQKGRFPGSFEAGPNSNLNNQIPHPWTIQLLPFLGEQTRYDSFYNHNANMTRNLVPVGAGAGAAEFQRFYVCPSDPDAVTGPQLSYVANMGREDDSTVPVSDVRGNGVFHNRFGVANPVSLSLTQLKDGAGQTVMLAENIDAGQWNYTVDPMMQPVREYAVGTLWLTSADALWAQKKDFNRDNLVAPAVATDATYTRPSSRHITVFNLVLCDGSTRDLSETVGYNVWQRLMTPHGNNAAGVPAEGCGLVNATDWPE